MPGRTQSATQLASPSFAAGHMMRSFRVYDEAGNVIETHEHAGEFKEW
jgi:hypothetical protein